MNLQVLYVLSIIYLSALTSFEGTEIFRKYLQELTVINIVMIIVTILCPLIVLLSWMFILPPTLKYLTIATNVKFKFISI